MHIQHCTKSGTLSNCLTLIMQKVLKSQVTFKRLASFLKESSLVGMAEKDDGSTTEC